MASRSNQLLHKATAHITSDDDIISESPAKKRKTENGNSGGYQSENDSGDDLFADNQDTIATIVLPRTQQQGPGDTQTASLHKDITQSQVNHDSNFPRSYSTQQQQTQPTQILGGASINGINDTKGTEARTNVAVDGNANASTKDGTSASGTKPIVQVQASSPVSEQGRHASPTKPAAPMIKGGILANAMAPPGTFFRKPFGWQQAASSGAVNSEEEDPPIEPISSDDDLNTSPADIRPSTFASSGRSHVQFKNPASSFKDMASRFAYSEKDSSDVKFSNDSTRRVTDDMASAYGSARRNKPPRQTAPSRAMPVQQDIELDEIPDYGFRQKVSRMSMIYPNKTITELRDALVRKKGNYNDAIESVSELEDKAGVDLTKSDDADNDVVILPKIPPAPKPTTKRQVKAPNRTIQEKWSSTQAAKGTLLSPQKPEPPQTTQVDTPSISKPKRRLVRGRKERSSPPAPSPEHGIETSLKRHSGGVRVSNAITIDSDTSSESDAGDTETENEEEDEEMGELEGQLLQFFNECKLEDLVDLSSQSEEVGKAIIESRPFRNLDAVREVNIEPSDTLSTSTKTGKKKTKPRKPVGDKAVDICLEMWAGYDAVDRLVKRCEELGKPITAEMEKWGFDVFGTSKDGELHLTSRKGEDGERPRDSGIGTPSSSAPVEEVEIGDDEDESEVKMISRRTKSNGNSNGSISKFLGQPECMTNDRPMKEYQLVGLNWLNLLWTKKLSCILADDMGLGKTCQVIAFLSHLYEIGRGNNDSCATTARGPHLVIVPGSTLENWLREFKMFSPELVVEPYYGLQNDRSEQRAKLEDNLSAINVIVTTYDTAWKPQDNKFLRHVVKPVVCVYDEGHALKNSNTKRYQQLMRIPAQFRLLLTGTPLQNNLQELSSLLSFMLPDLFESMTEDLAYIFKHKAKTTDSDHSALLSAQRISRARSMMTPFILRRRKHQVLKFLPKKTCRVEFCDLHPSQASLYAEELEKGQQALLDRAQGKKNANSANIMMALRKAAIHPLLFRKLFTNTTIRKMSRACLKEEKLHDRDPEAILEDMTWMSDFELHKLCEEYPTTLSKFRLQDSDWMMHSGKIVKLCELLTKFKSNGDRTLIFSQFTTVMDILEAALNSLGIQFFRLDGSTPIPTRQDMIDEFYRDESVSVFMLSTKAGGSGINLACANKVVIFDSSFNPQEDIQAENRAHRVGQTREVEVVRLVGKGTIEEQIYKLGESKLALDERVAGEGEGEGGNIVVATTDGDGAEDEKMAEKKGMEMVKEMMLQGLEEEKGKESGGKTDKKAAKGGKGGKPEGADGKEASVVRGAKSGSNKKGPASGASSSSSNGKNKDLKDMFLSGLKDAGVDVVA